jgi:hypothetical protein
MYKIFSMDFNKSLQIERIKHRLLYCTNKQSLDMHVCGVHTAVFMLHHKKVAEYLSVQERPYFSINSLFYRQDFLRNTAAMKWGEVYYSCFFRVKHVVDLSLELQ